MTTPTFSLGTPDETWSKYDLHEHPIQFNGKPTTVKAILRGEDQLVSIAGKGYQLLPNEEALKIANQAAELTGFVPFFEKMKDSAWTLGKPSGNILCNGKNTQMHAFYVPKEIEVELDHRSRAGHQIYTLRGEQVHVGVDVVNSIDGKKSFGVGTFSFRSICKNGVLFNSQNLGGVKHAHTISLKPVIEQLKTLFVQQMDHAREIFEGYQRLASEKVTTELIERLKKARLPSKVFPDYIQNDQPAPADTSKWDLYNDLTAGIWHNNENDVTGKEFQFNQLHRALPVIEVRSR